MVRISKDNGTGGGQPKQMWLEGRVTPGGKETTLSSWLAEQDNPLPCTQAQV